MSSKRFYAFASAVALALALPLHGEEAAAAPAAGSLTDGERAALVDMLERGRTQTEELITRAEGEQFTTKPGPERWSVAEVLEHIGATEKLLFGMVQQSLAGEPDPEAAGLLETLPIASFAERVSDRSQKAQAPDMLQPQGGKTREELLGGYRESHQAILEFVQTTPAPVSAHTSATPAGKFTAHHLLTLIAAHNLRHNQQIAEALDQLAAATAATTTTE
jgi:uncharacterized damage-inducible protein DinB